MRMDDNLNKLFDLEPKSNIAQEIIPLGETADVSKSEDDFELARSTMRNLIHRNEAVLCDLVDLARNSESPRVYEVAGQLIKTQSEMAKDLLTLHKQKKEVDGGESNQTIRQQNNIVFAGSTSDLMKMISAQKAKKVE